MKHSFAGITAISLAALCATGCGAQTFQRPQLELAAGEAAYATYGPWIFYQTSSEMFGGQLSCAAVANLPNSGTAVRVERVAEGYVFGVNGFDRQQIGANGEAPLGIWFDGDEAHGAENVGRFVRDPVLPNNDWLSGFQAIEDFDSPFENFITANEITFAVYGPGRDQRARPTFPIGTGEVVKRGLDRCYEMGRRVAEETEGPIAPCPGKGLRLPLSGLCLSEAETYLRIADGPEPELQGPCSWAINEAWLAGQMLLYRAAECSGRVSRLYGSADAHMASLERIETAYHEDGSAFGKLEAPLPYADVYARFKSTPAEDVEARALYEEPRDVVQRCSARRATEVSDGYIVDVSPAERARQPQDEPPAHLCGAYGYGDDADLWRVFQGYAWFLKLGQDYQDIDYRSLTLVEEDGKGGWQLVR
ncbi:hypothetical protein [Sphingosinithalassobacter portus]|uniref:hypothetical protein n=1 Tax=Stakelama portus TaxID=2676234 RepID=UPI000D6EAAD1|nr:hypothetical protein [Sphingosinithalassobacter portus]